MIAAVTARQSVLSVIGIALAVIGLWMLRKAIVEQRKAKEGTNYQRLDPDSDTVQKAAEAQADGPQPNETEGPAPSTETQTSGTDDTTADGPKEEPSEMETIRNNATLTLIKYALEVDTMVRMGTSDDPRKVTVSNDYLIFERKAKDQTTMNTIKMMPEMMANLAMVQMLRHENILDVVDAVYFTGKGIKTVWVGDDDERTEMVFAHASFDRVFEDCGHTPDKTRFLSKPKNIFG